MKELWYIDRFGADDSIRILKADNGSNKDCASSGLDFPVYIFEWLNMKNVWSVLNPTLPYIFIFFLCSKPLVNNYTLIYKEEITCFFVTRNH